MNRKIKTGIEIGLIILAFVLVSYLVQTNLEFFQNLVGDGYNGMAIYVILTIVSVVFAPISTLPLLPIASALWGWFATAILSIFGWLAGAMIAFWLGRKYGVDLIKKFISMEKLQRYQKSIPETHLFLGIIVLRNIFPVDILSYALGIFSNVKMRTYFWATLIGILPGAFLLAYLGGLPFKYQLVSFGIFLILALIIALLMKRFIKR